MAIFSASAVGRLIGRAKALVKKVERDFSTYNKAEFDELKKDILSYVTEETEKLYRNFVRIELVGKRGLTSDVIPTIFESLKSRSLVEWEMTLNRAFAESHDAATKFLQSIFTRVGKEVLRLRKYLSSFSGRALRHVEQLPGLVINHQGVNGGMLYTFYVGGSFAASVKVLNPRVEGGSRVVTDIRLGAPFESYGMFDLIVDWADRNFDNATLQTAPRQAPPVSEAMLLSFFNKYGFLITLSGGRRYIYTAAMPNWNDQQLLERPRRLFGFVRARSDFRGRWVMGFVNYLSLLFATIPRNLERAWMDYTIRLFDRLELFHIVGGVIDNSAQVCRWCNGKVLDKEAYDYVKDSPDLKTHLYHPRCRHISRPVPSDYNGPIYTLQDVLVAARRGLLGRTRS